MKTTRKLLVVALMTAVAATVPQVHVSAATRCECIFGGISSTGNPFCVAENCQELLVSAPPAIDVDRLGECTNSTIFVCPDEGEGGACYLACEEAEGKSQ